MKENRRSCAAHTIIGSINLPNELLNVMLVDGARTSTIYSLAVANISCSGAIIIKSCVHPIPPLLRDGNGGAKRITNRARFVKQSISARATYNSWESWANMHWYSSAGSDLCAPMLEMKHIFFWGQGRRERENTFINHMDGCCENEEPLRAQHGCSF